MPWIPAVDSVGHYQCPSADIVFRAQPPFPRAQSQKQIKENDPVRVSLYNPEITRSSAQGVVERALK